MSLRPAAPLAVTGLLLSLALPASALPAHATAPAPRPAAPPVAPVTRAAPAPGAATPLSGYAIQSSAEVSDTPEAISTPGYGAEGWHPAAARSTVLAALLADGTYKDDPFYSTNMKKIAAKDFSVPWWYRSDFTVGKAKHPETRTYLDFSGVLSAADVYVNGKRAAGADQVAGAYTRHELDITSLVRKGVNSVALKVRPNNPDKNLTMGWVDWLQPPPDANMGLVRDVLVRRGGPVALRDAHVSTKLALPGMGSADLTVKATARNETAAPLTTTVSGAIGPVRFGKRVTLAAHESRAVSFSPADTPRLRLAHPKVWWPAGMGGQPLYRLGLTAAVDGRTADTAHEEFGIRDVKAPLDPAGARRYSVNGRPLLIKGGGWLSDIFLRWDPRYVKDRLKYVTDLGLNTVRLEGHIEPDEFFELTDRMGILTLPGWECCGKWEGDNNGDEPGEKWTEADHRVAKASMAAEAARLRGHPSVISFLIGSDFAPGARTEKDYLDALKAADWPNPVVSSASKRPSPVLGASGMKMTGPYDWVPPNYWYAKREGGATGFNSETSAGPSVPTLDTLKRMLSPAELRTLWKDPSARQYHRSPSTTFGDLKLYGNALAGRYGRPKGLDDYVRKAQLTQYEAVRAEFEAYGRNASDRSKPSTGLIYWLLNSGWTSLHWQLFDRYLDQGGAYFGAKKAGEPLHIQYSYDDRSVVVVNQRHTAAAGLRAQVGLYTPDGRRKLVREAAVTAPGDGGKATALTLPARVPGLKGTYLAKLRLTDARGREVSRNVYWLSTKPDVLDWSRTDWYYTPTTSYADLTGLASMGRARVVSKSRTDQGPDGTSTTTVTLRRTGGGSAPALMTDVHVVDAAGRPVLPVRWTDNQVSLWPGESVTVTASYRTADLHGSAPSVRVSGWNTPQSTARSVLRTRKG
ncbi:sugar-binding domain-containing protein [Streptomyces sp. NPDC050610]|uniref:glycoside hydrolase family 2 protein n=1 Tax=Streptomyces sp. NPDC050610 TaxID=3157097 RepID=UPI003434A871